MPSILALSNLDALQVVDPELSECVPFAYAGELYERGVRWQQHGSGKGVEQALQFVVLGQRHRRYRPAIPELLSRV